MQHSKESSVPIDTFLIAFRISKKLQLKNPLITFFQEYYFFLSLSIGAFYCFMHSLNNLTQTRKPVECLQAVLIFFLTFSKSSFTTEKVSSQTNFFKCFIFQHSCKCLLFFPVLTPLILFFFARKKVGKYFYFPQECVKI